MQGISLVERVYRGPWNAKQTGRKIPYSKSKTNQGKLGNEYQKLDIGSNKILKVQFLKQDTFLPERIS